MSVCKSATTVVEGKGLKVYKTRTGIYFFKDFCIHFKMWDWDCRRCSFCTCWLLVVCLFCFFFYISLFLLLTVSLYFYLYHEICLIFAVNESIVLYIFTVTIVLDVRYSFSLFHFRFSLSLARFLILHVTEIFYKCVFLFLCKDVHICIFDASYHEFYLTGLQTMMFAHCFPKSAYTWCK